MLRGLHGLAEREPRVAPLASALQDRCRELAAFVESGAVDGKTTLRRELEWLLAAHKRKKQR